MSWFKRMRPRPEIPIRRELWRLRIYYPYNGAPALQSIANPKGSRGALQGYLVPLDRSPDQVDLAKAVMLSGRYGLVTADKTAGLDIAVGPVAGLPNGVGEALGSAVKEPAFLRSRLEILLAAEPFVAELSIADAGTHRLAAAEWIHQAADRIAGLSGGLVRDMILKRWWLPGAWSELYRNQDENFALPHVVVFAITGQPTWVHTLGLHRFGKPELETFLEGDKYAGLAGQYLLQVGSSLLSGAEMQVGEIVGGRNYRFGIAPGGRRDAHWRGTEVWELKGLDPDGTPLEYADGSFAKMK